jgi:hypothetical protein
MDWSSFDCSPLVRVGVLRALAAALDDEDGGAADRRLAPPARRPPFPPPPRSRGSPSSETHRTRGGERNPSSEDKPPQYIDLDDDPPPSSSSSSSFPPLLPSRPRSLFHRLRILVGDGADGVVDDPPTRRRGAAPDVLLALTVSWLATVTLHETTDAADDDSGAIAPSRLFCCG